MSDDIAANQRCERRVAAAKAFLDKPNDAGVRRLIRELRQIDHEAEGLDPEVAATACVIAAEKYGDRNVNVDPFDEADFSVADDAIWVSGWFRVTNKKLRKAGALTDEPEINPV